MDLYEVLKTAPYDRNNQARSPDLDRLLDFLEFLAYGLESGQGLQQPLLVLIQFLRGLVLVVLYPSLHGRTT